MVVKEAQINNTDFSHRTGYTSISSQLAVQQYVWKTYNICQEDMPKNNRRYTYATPCAVILCNACHAQRFFVTHVAPNQNQPCYLIVERNWKFDVTLKDLVSHTLNKKSNKTSCRAVFLFWANSTTIAFLGPILRPLRHIFGRLTPQWPRQRPRI